MTAWTALKAGFDAFTQRLPLLLGAWIVILAIQQAIDLLVPDSFVVLKLAITLIGLAPLYAGQQVLALKVVRRERGTFKDFFLGWRRWVAVSVSYLLVTGLTLLGLMLFILPGILIALSYAFVLIILVDPSREGPPPPILEALRESSRLSRGHRGTLFGISLLLALPVAVLSLFLLLSASNPGIPPWLVDVIALLSGTLFLGPVQVTSFMIVYSHAIEGDSVDSPVLDEGSSD
jgi:hypothetical protein